MLPVMKRHPRWAVWQERLSEYGPPGTCVIAAVVFALLGSWVTALTWAGGLVVALSYQHRLEQAWAWGWRTGKEDTLSRVMPLVPVDDVDPTQLREVFMAQGPSWREEQDRLAQVDHKATLEAGLIELERLWADKDGS